MIKDTVEDQTIGDTIISQNCKNSSHISESLRLLLINNNGQFYLYLTEVIYYFNQELSQIIAV